MQRDLKDENNLICILDQFMIDKIIKVKDMAKWQWNYGYQ